MYIAEHELLEVELTVAGVVGVPVRKSKPGAQDDAFFAFNGVLDSAPRPRFLPDPTWIETQWQDLLGFTNSTKIPPAARLEGV